MKQSKKLLSLVLAIIMMFGTVSVIANAAPAKSDVTYDRIDDAHLTAEQVADLVIDMLDEDVIYSINKGKELDLSILGSIRTDTAEHLLQDLYGFKTKLTLFGWLIGDVGDLDISCLKDIDTSKAGGHMDLLEKFIELLGNNTNAEILSKAVYGIETKNGLDLGIISSFIDESDLREINQYLEDIPGMLKGLVYDELIRGSYNAAYTNSSYPSLEDLDGALPENLDTFDEQLNRVVYALLTQPQDYKWVDNGDGTSTKVWDADSIVFPSIAEKYSESELKGALSTDSHSIFQILDTIAPFAINDLGIAALNNNLKKQLMEAVDVDFNEIKASEVPAEVKKVFDAEEYVTYISYDCMEKGNDGAWYYTTLKTTDVIDPATGEAKVDDNGKKVTEKTRKYYKANALEANEFYDLINWDWEFVKDAQPLDINDAQALNCIDYEYLISTYGSIFGSLNHLVYIVYENALTAETKADFAAVTGKGWVDGTNEDCLMNNLTRLGKYLLANYGDKMFGKDSAYANISYESIKDKSVVELIADMGPGFFTDAMPQLIMPINKETGNYAFGDDSQLLKFGALVIREFITEISPTTNYDAYIFAEGTVTSANDRQFATHTTDEWFNIILNMGMDIAYTYLDQLTNFESARPTVDKTSAVGDTRWMGMLDEAIMWAVNYVGSGSTSVLQGGFDPTTVGAIEGPLNKLSHLLNKLLPLGFISGCTTESYAFDVSVLFENIKKLFTEFDLNAILSLFGRNTEAYNILNTKVEEMLLKLVNDILALVFGTDLITSLGTTLDGVVTTANLKTLVKNLLVALNSVKTPLLKNALPVLGKLMPEWGGEQEYNAPKISLSDSVSLTNGATSADVTVNVKNQAEGMWRHYRDAAGNEYTDEQYKIQLTSVTAYNFDGSASSYVTVKSVDTSVVDYGKSGSFMYSVAGVPAEGAAVRFDVKYKVYDEDGNAMANGNEFTVRQYVWLNYNSTDAKAPVQNTKNDARLGTWTPQYVGLSAAGRDPVEYFGNLSTSEVWRKEKYGSSQTVSLVNNSGTVDGLTFSGFSVKIDSIWINNEEYYANSIRNFSTYTENLLELKDGSTQRTFDIKGSVNADAWKAANKQPGDETVFNISLKNTTKDTNVTTNFVLKYYDDTSYNNLASLVGKEMSNVRLYDEYYDGGYYYTSSLLTNANSTDKNGEKVIRQSNYASVWILEEDAGYSAGGVTEYADSQVTVTAKNSDDVATRGTVLVNGKEEAVIKSTKIDCEAAVAHYKTTFAQAMRSGKQVWNANSIYTQTADYEAFRVAVNDMNYCKKPAGVQASAVDEDIGERIDALKATIANVKANYSDNKDYTDYKMYRWNRYTDALKDAEKLVTLKNDASSLSVSEIDESFPYTSIDEDDLRALVKGDANQALILALLEPMTEDEITAKENWLAGKKESYASKTLLDVEMASNILTRVASRLLERDGGVNATYLKDEIASAKAMITDLSKYTDRSVAIYSAALAAAEEVAANPTQMSAFDAKYELQVARNGLVLKENEADYSDLEALIEQAKYALSHQSLYNNTAKEFGQVLAELGYDPITNADGDDVQLFPGSALLVNEKAYSTEDQKKVDRAANALREALARLKFNGVSVGESVVLEKDDNGEATKTAQILKVNQKMTAAAILANTSVQSGATGVLSSNDYYALSGDDAGKYAGTGSTYTWMNANAPICTVKIVVMGDVNGDGVVDVLDAATVERVANNHTTLKDLYFVAGNAVASNEVIDAADYSAVVNLALAE